MCFKHIYFLILFIVIYFIVPYNSAKILCVFPVPSISHQVVFRPLTEELARRGHEVTIMTTDPAFSKGKTPKNIKEIDVHDISYEIWVEKFVKNVVGDRGDSFNVAKSIFYSMVDIFENQMKTEEMQVILKGNEHYDLIFTEAMVRPALVFSHLLKAPLIQISSFGAMPPSNQVFGSTTHPIILPQMLQRRHNNLTFWEKLLEIYEDIRCTRMITELEEPENAMLLRLFGPNIPKVSELCNIPDLLFLNVDPIFEGNRPAPPSVIYLGGLHQRPQKNLPKDLETYLDDSKHGVIYMSFGTNVNSSQLPTERIQLFNRVFSKLPYDVLWKWDKDEMLEKAKNVKIFKWLPQSDLLRHSNIKLFITQGGLQSTDEAITAGVPLIAFPMLGDQYFNAEKYVYHKIGFHHDFNNIKEEDLEYSIKTVIEDQRYRLNIVKLGKLIRDQPMKPLEKAVWWTEYVIRHGGAKHLRSPAANMSWSEWLILDVLIFVLAVVIIGLNVVAALIYVIVKYLFSKDDKIKNN